MSGRGGLLLRERQVAAQPSLVRALGLVQAVVLQQIAWHIDAAEHGVELDDEEWFPITQEKLGTEIGVGRDAIYRALQGLESVGVLLSCQPEGHVSRRKWYRIDYEHDLLDCAAARDGSARERAVPLRDIAQSSSAKPLEPREPTRDELPLVIAEGDERETELEAARASEVSARSQGDAPDKKPSGRRRNPVWDGLAAVFGDPAPSERAFFGKVVRELVANPDATEQEVRVRARRAQQRFTSPSVQAVAKHWTLLGQEPGRRRVANDAPEWDETDGPVQVREWDG